MTENEVGLTLVKIKDECEDIIDEVMSIQSGQTAADFEDAILVMKACRDSIDDNIDKLSERLRDLESKEVEFTEKVYDKWRPTSMEEIMKKARS